ncbi:phage regulatory protein, rha family [Amphritea atlantica]|uniref:Phage regulatory protein, rha family n=1 Tax=Amphritea atlantica TaxID=355243 RepID=A0A1H9GGT6_9GAMM|nr:Rha family transcriptional regulator [Amphritea atlantica]SEQ49304.1 phage regulatory protein, rha family [Amphritea atlantica]
MTAQSTIQTISLKPQDIISVANDQVRTTSLKVAEAFGKQHKHVLDRLGRLECSPEFASANFSADVQSIDIGNGAKRNSKIYQMTKDGFMFLVMGFTGKKAAAVKEAYINAFNWMADQLKEREDRVGQLPKITYWDKPVVTFEMVDEAHGRKIGHANRRFYDNRARFVLGEDYFKIHAADKAAFEGVGVHVPGRGLIVLTRSGYDKLVAKFAEPGADFTRQQMRERYFAVQGGNVVSPALMQAYELCVKWLTIQKYAVSNEQKIIDLFAWRLDVDDWGERLEKGGSPDGLPLQDQPKLTEAVDLLMQRVQLEGAAHAHHDYMKESLRCAEREIAWAKRWQLI